MINIFISHSSEDNKVAQDLIARLRFEGYQSLFLDFDPALGIQVGQDWAERILRDLDGCRAVVLLCTDDFMKSRWCFAEAVLGRMRGKQIFPFQLCKCEPFAELGHIQAVRAWDVGWEEACQRLLGGLRAAGFDPADDFILDPSECPYPGLAAFNENLAAAYCGRDEEIYTLVNRLGSMHTHREPSLAVVIGGSGYGKSSLVRAGVVPRLKKEKTRWVVVPPFSPGTQPFTALAQSLHQAFPKALERVQPPEAPARQQPADWKEIRDQLADERGGARRLAELAGDLALAHGSRDLAVLLVVDQFEELLYGQARNEADRFLDVLTTVWKDRSNQILGLATLRSDFLDAFQQHPRLLGFPFANQPLGPLPPERLYDVIRKPAVQAKIDVEDSLVDHLVRDTRTNYALPLLAFTLQQMWEKVREEKPRRFTLAAYDGLGGINKVIERVVAQAVTPELTPVLEARLRPAFLMMARLNEEGQFVRQRVRWDKLPDDAREPLDRFIAKRLLTLIEDPGGPRYVEVVHESLFEVWDMLKGWLENTKEFRLWQQRLAKEIDDWIKDGKSEGYLLQSEARVVEARKWLETAPQDLSNVEREFVTSSLDAWNEEQERLRQFEEDRHRHLVEHEEAAKALLAAGRWAEAHGRLGQALQSLRGEDSPDLLRRRAELERQYDRVGRVERFHRRALEFYSRAGEESYDEAYEACRDALDALEVFKRERWWEHLPVQDLSGEQVERLKREAYRQLILLSGLRIVPGLMKLQPKGESSRNKSRLGKLVSLMPKVSGLLPLVKLILRPSWREWIFQRLKARIPRMPEAAADFESALEALSAVRAFEEARAAEAGRTFRPSRISQIVKRVAYLALEVTTEAGTSLRHSLPAPERLQADAGPDPTNPVDFYLVGLLHFFIGKRGDSILTWLIQLFPQRFPDVDGSAPLETAELLLRRSIDLETDNFWPYFVLGRTLSAKGDQRGAELAFNSCISLDPDYARGYEQRALTIAKQWEASTGRLRRLLVRVPGVRSLLGRSAPVEELRERALADSHRAVSRAEKQGDPSTYWPQGELYEALGQVHEALDAYARALALEKDLHAMISRGTNILRLADLAAKQFRRHGTRSRLAGLAAKQFRRRGTRPNAGSRQVAADAQAILALLAFIRDEYDDAIQAAEAALHIIPDHAHALAVHGTVSLRRGRAAEARIDLDLAVSRDPRQFLAALGLAETLEQLGESDAARSAYDRLRRPDAEGRQAPEWIRRKAEREADRLAGARHAT